MNHLTQFHRDYLSYRTRRHFLRDCATGLGGMWWASQAGRPASAADQARPIQPDPAVPLAVRPPHFEPKAKRVIFLHMAGAPSQLELFDYKPELQEYDGKECPQELLEGARFAFIRGIPKLLGPTYPFHQAGESGHWISDRMPLFEELIDNVCFLRSMQCDQFNHAPAQLLMHTGNQNFGYGSLGSWITYGLGSENQDMPGFIVLISGGQFPSAGKAAWGSGFLPSVYQGVQCRSEGDPVLYLSNPGGMSRPLRRQIVEAINDLNRRTYQEAGDPETLTRIAQYEMAYRMQITASDVLGIEEEPQHIHKLYGTEPGRESFANNCLLARRLVERGVRFVQLFDWGWDMHGTASGVALNTEDGFEKKCRDIDRPIYALLTDLKQRGLLEDTLVVWGGEFGRTPMQENRAGRELRFKGRDHHPFAFTMWMAGAGVRAGHSIGETDPLGYRPTTQPILVRDLHATILHLLGFDHHGLIYPFQGLDQKITGVRPARVVEEALS